MADNLLPLSDDDDDKRDDPFEEFINKDLGMDSVAQEGGTTPADDRSLSARLQASSDSFDEDDPSDEEYGNSRGNLPRFGGFGAPRSPFGGSSSESPFGRSPFGNRPSFGSSSGTSGFGKGRFSGSFPSSSSSSSNPFSRPSGSLPPLRPLGSLRSSVAPRGFWERFRSEIGKYLGDELIGIFVALVVFLIVLCTMLYIDNLRMGLAVRDGQIIELNNQIQELQQQLTPVSPLVGTPAS